MFDLLEKIAIPEDAFSKRLKARERALAEARGMAHKPPGSRISGVGSHPVLEKEIIKQTGPSTGQKIKYHTLGRLKRFWGQPGKYKLLRRAGVLGGLTGLGLLGKAWYDAAQNEKVLKNLQAQQALRKFSAKKDYRPEAPVTPKPPGYPSEPAPMSTSAGPPNTPPPPESLEYAEKSQKPPKPPKLKTAEEVISKIAFLEEGATPWLAGAGGGVGGYLLGKKVVDPLLKMKQESILNNIRKGRKIVEGLEKSRKIAPLAGATIGALLLAALTAKKAKDKQIEDMLRIQAAGGPGQEGFYPYNVRSVRDPRAAYYG